MNAKKPAGSLFELSKVYEWLSLSRAQRRNQSAPSGSVIEAETLKSVFAQTGAKVETSQQSQDITHVTVGHGENRLSVTFGASAEGTVNLASYPGLKRAVDYTVERVSTPLNPNQYEQSVFAPRASLAR